MRTNNTENGFDQAIPNQVRQLRREMDDLKSTPQPIGNGSINYATFSEFNLGPVTIPSGLMASFSVLFAPSASPLYYDGLEAINRRTLNDLYWTVKVDVNDADHAIPYGAALAGPERLAITSSRLDYYNSGLSDVNGQMYVLMQITNIDTVTHNYWIAGKMLIPRPALKPF